MWVKLDDRFWSNPKITSLSNAAHRLYVNSICYSCDQRTDGIISRHALRGLLPHMSDSGRRRARAELVDRLLWVELVPARWWEIHDFASFNPARKRSRAGG